MSHIDALEDAAEALADVHDMDVPWRMSKLANLLAAGTFYNAQHEKSDLHIQAADRIKALEAAMQNFVARVDRGEVRSKRTYAQFKELLTQGSDK